MDTFLFDNRYTAKDLELISWKIPCKHPEKQSFKCSQLSVKLLRKAKKVVYQHADKKEQDTRISYLIETKSPTRPKKRSDSQEKNVRKISPQYYISVS